jgi:Flp pilus assembly protein TadG
MRVRLESKQVRRGVMLIESLILMATVAVLLSGFIGLSQMMRAQHVLQLAAREGARVAAVGGDGNSVEAAVRRVLISDGYGVMSATAEITLFEMTPSAVSVPGSAVGVAVKVFASATTPFYPAMLLDPTYQLAGLSIMQVE